MGRTETHDVLVECVNIWFPVPPPERPLHFLGIRKILLIQDSPKPKSQIDRCVDGAWLAQSLDSPDNCLDGHAVIDR